MTHFDGIYRYVVYGRVPTYEALGWLFAADLGPVHGSWSVLMRWPCGCKCREPKR